MNTQEAKEAYTILVVDDVHVNVKVLTNYLNSAGYKVISAHNGQEALEKVAIHYPDLILLDVMMPKLNGFEVCERLKSDRTTRVIPVLMITSLNEIEDKIKATTQSSQRIAQRPLQLEWLNGAPTAPYWSFS